MKIVFCTSLLLALWSIIFETTYGLKGPKRRSSSAKKHSTKGRSSSGSSSSKASTGSWEFLGEPIPPSLEEVKTAFNDVVKLVHEEKALENEIEEVHFVGHVLVQERPTEQTNLIHKELLNAMAPFEHLRTQLANAIEKTHLHQQKFADPEWLEPFFHNMSTEQITYLIFAFEQVLQNDVRQLLDKLRNTSVQFGWTIYKKLWQEAREPRHNKKFFLQLLNINADNHLKANLASFYNVNRSWKEMIREICKDFYYYTESQIKEAIAEIPDNNLIFIDKALKRKQYFKPALFNPLHAEMLQAINAQMPKETKRKLIIARELAKQKLWLWFETKQSLKSFNLDPINKIIETPITRRQFETLAVSLADLRPNKGYPESNELHSYLNEISSKAPEATVLILLELVNYMQLDDELETLNKDQLDSKLKIKDFGENNLSHVLEYKRHFENKSNFRIRKLAIALYLIEKILLDHLTQIKSSLKHEYKDIDMLKNVLEVVLKQQDAMWNESQLLGEPQKRQFFALLGEDSEKIIESLITLAQKLEAQEGSFDQQNWEALLDEFIKNNYFFDRNKLERDVSKLIKLKNIEFLNNFFQAVIQHRHKYLHTDCLTPNQGRLIKELAKILKKKQRSVYH